MIDAKGCLTIGWRGDVRGAWRLVLKILEEHALAQAIAQSALPEGGAANPVPVGAAANPSAVEAAKKRRRLIAAESWKRKHSTAFPEEEVSAEEDIEDIHISFRNPEPYISIRCALANLGRGQPWLMERMRFVAPGLVNGCGPELQSPEEKLLRISPRLPGCPGGKIYPDCPESWKKSDAYVQYATHIESIRR